MGAELYINPERIAKHGKELKAEILPTLEKAQSILNEDGIYNLEGGDFSITCTMASMAYPGAVQFMFEDLDTHKQMIEGFAKGINTTADNYRASEEASRVKQV